MKEYLKRNCYTCKYHMVGDTMDWSDYCSKQNWESIANQKVTLFK